ncbi:type II toxin-antitoxin system PemK/MazF family toxin [Rickettsia bellii]|uniref:PemK-like family protein n=2 Tax=Rickettsia bellii TaxID=33990 RepID=A0A0F3QFT8_RICBE|nr:type II toxin-antitoxin system PemK/MazF family toxin [Rickettsia bellii]KJV89266.1 pemK-like family protein [Rickettsia bellii str. RML An4]KJV91450.1 pemK-like family protein [Rickettsia bellii str. RML Mogi]
MEKGDIIICVLSGDYGKPRPAVIVQSDLFNETHASITICPIITYLLEAPLFRLSLIPSKLTGLISESQIMIDKIITIKSEKIDRKIGKLSSNEMIKLDNALKLWLNLS